MLFSTSTISVYGELKNVSGGVFSDFLPYIVVLISIILGFFIIEVVIHSVTGRKFDENNTDVYNE